MLFNFDIIFHTIQICYCQYVTDIDICVDASLIIRIVGTATNSDYSENRRLAIRILAKLIIRRRLKASGLHPAYRDVIDPHSSECHVHATDSDSNDKAEK